MATGRQAAEQIHDELEAMPTHDLIKWFRNTPPSVVEATYRELGALNPDDDGVIDLTD